MEESENAVPAMDGGADARYMEIIQKATRGDTDWKTRHDLFAEAARMVREAAGRAMPDTQIVADDGLPLLVYHGTPDCLVDYDDRRPILVHAYARLTDNAVREFNDEYHRLVPTAKVQFDNIFRIKQFLDDGVGYNPIPGNVGIMQQKAIDLLGIWKPDKFGRVRKKPNDIFGYGMEDFLEEHFDELTTEEKYALKAEYFTVFNIKKAGYSTEAMDAKMGFFFTPNRDFAYRFTYHVEQQAFGPVNVGKPKIVNGNKPRIYSCFLNARKVFDARHVTQYDFEAFGYDLGFNSLKEMRAVARSIDGQKSIQKNMAAIKGVLFENGYDGMRNRLHDEGFSTEEIIVFHPNQIKSADACTYDYDGNVIPLSQRFDLSNPDIRY